MGNDKQDYGDFLVVFLIILIALMQILWLYKYDWFVAVWYTFKYPVYLVISMIPPNVIDIMYGWVFWDDNFTTNIKSVSDIVTRHPLSEFRNEQLMDDALADNGVTLRQFVSYTNILTTKVLVLPTLPVLIWLIKKIKSKERFNKTHSVESLGIQEAAIWPQIKPVIYEYNAFVNTKNLDEGWFAMAAKPKDYLLKHNLLEDHIYNDEDDFETYGKQYYKLKTTTMYEVLINELGSAWKGVDNLSFEKKAILSIILPRLTREPKLSKKMNDNLAILHSSMPDKSKLNSGKLIKNILFFKFTDALKMLRNNKEQNSSRNRIIKETNAMRKIVEKDMNAILNKFFQKDQYKKSMFGKSKLVKKAEMLPIVKEILDSHFYEKTVFAAFLERARLTGVLASCEFIWLKKINRPMWYMMSQTGRTACFIECAGSWAHYITEKRVGSKVASPMVVNAIHAADKYMFKTHFNYDPINKYDEF